MGIRKFWSEFTHRVGLKTSDVLMVGNSDNGLPEFCTIDELLAFLSSTSNSSVTYVAQALNAMQQAQARTNISAASIIDLQSLQRMVGAISTSGNPIIYQYSVNGTAWHSPFATGDLYTRLSDDNGTTWSLPIRVGLIPGSSSMTVFSAWSDMTDYTGYFIISDKSTMAGRPIGLPIPTTTDLWYVGMKADAGSGMSGYWIIGSNNNAYFATSARGTVVQIPSQTDISQLYSNQQFIEGEIMALEDGKVDKISGKGLSANDLTNMLLAYLNSKKDGSYKGAYDAEVQSAPSSGNLTLKNWTETHIGTITGSNVFSVALPSPTNGLVNESILLMVIGASLPTITMPVGIVWRGTAPTLAVSTAWTIVFEQIWDGSVWAIRGTAVKNVS